ncbi:MAG: UDP-N-acetylmuramate dehydrogenase [Thermoanaerobaculia bacterium]
MAEELFHALGAAPGLRIERDVPLARHTTWRIGGAAEALVEVHTERALRRLLTLLHAEQVPTHLLGLGSNVLIPDEGLPGAVLRLAGGFLRYRVWGRRVTAGGGIPLPRLARAMAVRGLVGIEALTGFPSTVGGAVNMNAGCYGTEIADVLVAATVVDRAGARRRVGVAELEPGYRSTRLQGSGDIVSRATLELAAGDAEAAEARIRELNARRRLSLPGGLPNAGSTFKNPPGDYAGRLIEAAGLKGAAQGGARISPRHANVIVNEDGARAADVLSLMLRAYQEVEERFGVRLEPEVVLAGSLAVLWREGTETLGYTANERSLEKKGDME